MTVQREAPLYQCHKQVRALKIAAIKIDYGSLTAEITPADEGYAPFGTPTGWLTRYTAGTDPGYYVVYDDGYASWSPTKAFEDGYTRLAS